MTSDRTRTSRPTARAPQWYNAQVRRRLQITLYVVAAGFVLMLTVVLIASIVQGSDFSRSDKLAALNDIIAGAALILALASGAIALQSFAASTNTPDIEIQVWFGGVQMNRLTVLSEVTRDG